MTPEELREPTETEVAELKMHAVRLMRSGSFSTADEVRRAMRDDFPQISHAAINRALSTVAQKFIENGRYA